MDGALPLDVEGAIRPTSEDDAAELFAVVDRSRGSLRRWMAWVDENTTVDDTRAYLEACTARRAQGTEDNHVMLLGGRIVGVIGLRAIDRANRAAEIGYWIAPSAEGHGIVTEACRALVDEAFTTRALHRVRIACAVGNARSRAIPERLGFEQEGVARQVERLADGFVDHAIYAALSSDWPATPKSSTTLEDPYDEALARVHDEGFTQLARGAAVCLSSTLHDAGFACGTVAEFGCGSGVTLRSLCDRGFDPFGVDISPPMIARARASIPAGTFRVASFLDVELPRCVAVAAIGEVFNYAFDARNDDAQRAALFVRVFAALEPGGVFVFDVATPERATSYSQPRFWVEGDGWVVAVEISADVEARTLQRDISTFIADAGTYTRHREVHRLGLLDHDTVARELADAGFSVRTVERYGDVPTLPGSAAFIATKPRA